MATLDEFMVRIEEHEMLYYSNWMTHFRHACEKADIDPDELMNKKVKRGKKNGKRK